MKQSYYHFKALTHILNVNQIRSSSDEFRIILDDLQKGDFSEVKESFSMLGRIVEESLRWKR